MPTSEWNDERYLRGMELLVEVVQQLSLAPDLDSIVNVVKRAARQLTGADGASFVLKEEGFCYYVDEDAIGPLWKGKRFPLSACVSGWAMKHREAALIPDIYQDPRVPIDAYSPTFVRSLAMVPIRRESPIGAIGNYWADNHLATPVEMRLLQSLADSTSVAIHNVQLLASLRRQLELRDEFISVAGHELKTPLTPALIQLQMIQRQFRPGAVLNREKLLCAAELISRQLSRFGKLVDNLLDVSRIRLGEWEFSAESGVDLSEMVSRLVNQFQAGVSFPIEVAVADGLKGSWDPLRIEQVVTNLLANAVRYGEGKPFRVEARAGDGGVEIIVVDQGIGVPLDAQERIFERFERASSYITYGGLGLGLFIVRQIVNKHGGNVSVESAPGKGSTFRVWLPWTAEFALPLAS